MAVLTPDLLLRAQAAGLFPMADGAESADLGWYDPPYRGIIPLEQFHVPRSLAKLYRKSPFALTIDLGFERIIRLCAEASPDRPSTWINNDIVQAYCDLHALGHAHSIEAQEGQELVGGLYGVALGAAFFGESMVSRRPNASRLALVHLVDAMKEGGFTLLDTQFTNDHLAQFGCVEIPREEYRARLDSAIRSGVTQLPGSLRPQSYRLM